MTPEQQDIMQQLSQMGDVVYVKEDGSRIILNEEGKIPLKTNADAVFYCGTAAEVIGFDSLDDQKFALNWNDSVSRKIQTAYKNLVVENFEPQRQEEAKKEEAVA